MSWHLIFAASHVMAIMTGKCQKKVTEKWVFVASVLADRRLASSRRHVESASPPCTLIAVLLRELTNSLSLVNHYRSAPLIKYRFSPVAEKR